MNDLAFALVENWLCNSPLSTCEQLMRTMRRLMSATASKVLNAVIIGAGFDLRARTHYPAYLISYTHALRTVGDGCSGSRVGGAAS
jgi:hypothetical protein